MTGLTMQGCNLFERAFASSRALTQHRRFVHDGAALFGYRLTEERGKDASSSAESSIDSDEPEKRPIEDEPSDEMVDSALYWLVLAGTFLAAVIFLSQGKPTPVPPAEGPGVPPCSPYGACLVRWAPM